MRHDHTNEPPQPTETLDVRPSVLSILYYLDELESQVSIIEDDTPTSATPSDE